MSLNSRAKCSKCGGTYSVFTSETKILPGMKLGNANKENKKILKTWEDWVLHILNNCPNCRIRIIPPDCLKDYELKKKLHESRKF